MGSVETNKKSELLIYDVWLRSWHVFQCVTELEIADWR